VELESLAAVHVDRVANLEKSLQVAIENHATQLRDIYQSSSWRLTTPVRRLGQARHLLRTKGLREVVRMVGQRIKWRLASRSRQLLAPPGQSAAQNLSPRAQKIWSDLRRAFDNRRAN
jgi:hypothetical protein